MNVIDNIVRVRSAAQSIRRAGACVTVAHPDLGWNNAVAVCVENLARVILENLEDIEGFVTVIDDAPLKPTIPGTVRELRQALAGLPDDLPIGFTASDIGRFRFGHEHPNNGIRIWRNQGDELESADVILEPVFVSAAGTGPVSSVSQFDTGPVTVSAQAQGETDGNNP